MRHLVPGIYRQLSANGYISLLRSSYFLPSSPGSDTLHEVVVLLEILSPLLFFFSNLSFVCNWRSAIPYPYLPSSFFVRDLASSPPFRPLETLSLVLPLSTAVTPPFPSNVKDCGGFPLLEEVLQYSPFSNTRFSFQLIVDCPFRLVQSLLCCPFFFSPRESFHVVKGGALRPFC